MRFYKRDPDRALAGMAELSLEERGAYNTILDALYARDGILADNDEILRRLMACHGNKWRAVKTRLIAHGKIWIEDGYMKAKGVDSTLAEAAIFSETQKKRAEKRWEMERKSPRNASEKAEKSVGKSGKSQQNQCSADAKGIDASTDIDTAKERKESIPPEEQASDESKYAFKGKIIKLNKRDFESWSSAYDAIPDLRAELTVLDDYYHQELKGDARKKWFVRASAALGKRHQERIANTAQEVNGHRSLAEDHLAMWTARVIGYRTSGFWIDQWGYPPGDKDCQVPQEALDAGT